MGGTMRGRFRSGLAVCGLALVLGCQDSIVRLLGPENDPQTVITPEEFRFSATDLRNVNDRESWTWANSAPQASVHHDSFLHRGVDMPRTSPVPRFPASRPCS